jgi:hypothetical protein
MCLLEHAPPTLLQRWRDWRTGRRLRRNYLRAAGVQGIHLLDDVSAPPDVLPPSAAVLPREPQQRTDLPDPTITTFRRRHL